MTGDTATVSSTTAAQARWDAVMMRNYGTPPVALSHGSGAHVWDVDGRQYLDLVGGIAVSSLGHAHPAVVDAVSTQVATLAHTSNLAIHEPGLALAERLAAMVPGGARVFLCQDGATANEAALKIVRKHMQGRRTEVVSTEGGFHGRTLGALSVTGTLSKRAPFEPLPGPVTFVAYADVEALRAAVTDATAAVILEPVQGEGGVIVPPAGYLAAAREICDAVGALLVVDEVQSGIGRAGEWLLSVAQGVVPDVITLAKGLGGGLPIGAVLATGDAALVLQPGRPRLDVRRQPGLLRRGARCPRHDRARRPPRARPRPRRPVGGGVRRDRPPAAGVPPRAGAVARARAGRARGARPRGCRRATPATS